ncbi:Type II secretion system protein G precursor [compost metagenome]|jgi:general secretion pathway protein G
MGRRPQSNINIRRRAREGYTLTEMLVVLVIIGLISAIIVPQTLGQMDRAKARSARLKLESVAAALEMYSADLARYPTETEGLDALLEPPAEVPEWTGPYLSERSLLKDPWGGDILYEPPATPGEKFTLTSLGADAAPGGKGFKRDIILRPGE